jgi:hypothetical protein
MDRRFLKNAQTHLIFVKSGGQCAHGIARSL